MIRRSIRWTFVAAVAAWAPLALAQMDQQQPVVQPMQAQVQPDQHQAALSKVDTFLNDQTAAVVHINLQQADLKRAQQFFTGVIGGADLPAPQKQQATTQLGAVMAMAETWRDRLKEAGAHDLFVITYVQDGQTPLAVIVPTDEQNQQQVKQLLTPPADEQVMGRNPETRVIRNAVVLSTAPVLQELEQASADSAQMLHEAFESVQQASAEILIKPSAELQQAMKRQGAAEMIPFNPAGQVDFDQAVDWVAVGIDYPQQEQILKVVMSATDEQKARQLSQALTQQIAQARQARAGEAQLASLQALEPEVEGNRVTISLTREDAARLLRQGMKAAPGDMMPHTTPGQTQQQDQMHQPANP